MTTLTEAPVAGALDVRAFLLGDEGPELLRERLAALRSSEQGPLGALRGAVRSAVDEELAEAAAGFLDIDLGATAVAGWRLHTQLMAAARKTAATPGLRERVPLDTHTMTSTWEPGVEVHLGPATVARLSFQVQVVFEIVGLHATVVEGRLVRLGGGSGTVAATLSLAGQVLVERTAPFDACLGVPLGRGLSLFEVPEPRTSPSVVESEPADAPSATPGADAGGRTAPAQPAPPPDGERSAD